MNGHLYVRFSNICAWENGRNDAPDLEPVFRGVGYNNIILFSPISATYTHYNITIYAHVRPRDIIIIILWYYRVYELLRPGVTEEAINVCVYDKDNNHTTMMILLYSCRILAMVIDSTICDCTARLNATTKRLCFLLI